MTVEPLAFDGIEASKPASYHFSITPSDSQDLAIIPRAVIIMTGGDIVIRDKEGTDITYTVSDGTLLPLRAVRILSTGTTATGIVGLY